MGYRMPLEEMEIRDYTLMRIGDILWRYVEFLEGKTDINPYGLSEVLIVHQYKTMMKEG